MDAAIAGAVVLGICEPQMTGLGGDCFVLWSRPGETTINALNGSGRAPSAADSAALRTDGHANVPTHSAQAVTIPGAVDAFCSLSETEGRIGLDAILQPAIHYADQGVPVAARVAADWRKDASVLQGAARKSYLHNDQPLKAGQMLDRKSVV